MRYKKRCEIGEMVGKTFIKIHKTNDTINFMCSDGTEFKMFHEQDCCESVTIEDITGDLDDLLNSPILLASEDTNTKSHPENNMFEYPLGSFTYTFYTIRNINATVQIRWYGESNGYYSESVIIEKYESLMSKEDQVP